MRVVVSLRSLVLSHSFSCTHRMAQGSRCPRVCLISSIHEVGVHSSTLSSPSPSSSSSHSSSTSSSSCSPSTSPRLNSKIPCATSPRRCTARQCIDSRQFLRVHLSHRMCDQFAFYHKFRIDTGRTKFGQKTDGILYVCGSHGQRTQRSE